MGVADNIKNKRNKEEGLCSAQSIVDYCFLLNPHQYASSTLTLNKFEIALPRNEEIINENSDDIEYYTDHCALIMDFSWN